MLETYAVKHLFVIRDPRDIAVSNFYYITYKDRGHRLHEYFSRSLTSDSDRLMASIAGISASKLPDGRESRGIAAHLRSYTGWLSDPRCLVVRFEDLVGYRGGGSDALRDDTIARVFNFLGLGMSPTELEAISRALYSSNSRTFFRGQIGGWREHFSREHEEVFEREAGGLLALMGYFS